MADPAFDWNTEATPVQTPAPPPAAFDWESEATPVSPSTQTLATGQDNQPFDWGNESRPVPGKQSFGSAVVQAGKDTLNSIEQLPSDIGTLVSAPFKGANAAYHNVQPLVSQGTAALTNGAIGDKNAIANWKPSEQDTKGLDQPIEYDTAPTMQGAQKFAYQMGEMAPTMAAGAVGARFGGSGGAMGGAAAESALQNFMPLYYEESKKTPTDHAGAMNRALMRSAETGGYTAAQIAAMGIPNILNQVIAVGGTGALQKINNNIEEGKPWLQDVENSSVQNVLGGFVFNAALKGGETLWNARNKPLEGEVIPPEEQAKPTNGGLPPPGPPTIDGEFSDISNQTPPPEPPSAPPQQPAAAPEAASPAQPTPEPSNTAPEANSWLFGNQQSPTPSARPFEPVFDFDTQKFIVTGPQGDTVSKPYETQEEASQEADRLNSLNEGSVKSAGRHAVQKEIENETQQTPSVPTKPQSVAPPQQPPVQQPVQPPVPADVPQAAEPQPVPAPVTTVSEHATPVAVSKQIPYMEVQNGADMAITSTGQSVPVQYAVVEANHLIPSHTDDLTENPDYPQDIQPRDRTRGSTERQITEMLNPEKFQPALLAGSPNAENGAPIIGNDGVVESGNGRTMALRRAYSQNLPAAKMYKSYLEQEGYPVEGFNQPVLVRVNQAPMTREQRAQFARDANRPAQLAMSATERAMADGSALKNETFELAQSPDLMAADNRMFVRSVLNQIASPNEQASLITPEGGLSQEGLRRIQGAMIAKAYGDPTLIQNLLESTDSNYKAIGNALIEASPRWAKMRAEATANQIPQELDITPNLMEAVALIGRSRTEGTPVPILVNKMDMFSGQLSPETESVLKWLTGPDFTKRVSQAKIAIAAKLYAEEAMKVQPGPDLFGGEAGATKPLTLTEFARGKAQAVPEQQPDLFNRPPVEEQPRPTNIRQGTPENRPNDVRPANVSTGPKKSGGVSTAKPEQLPKPAAQQPEQRAASRGDGQQRNGIEDFGQKIQGAKKDLWATYNKSLTDELPADMKDVTLAKYFPEPDYESLIKDGVSVKALATIKALRDAIPAKPQKSWKLKDWGNTLKLFREMSSHILNEKDFLEDKLLKRMENWRNLYEYKQQIELYSELGYPLFTKAKGWEVHKSMVSMYKGEHFNPAKTMWTVAEGNHFGQAFETRPEAIEYLKNKLSTEKEEPKKTQLDIYRITSTGEIVIGKKVAPGKFVDLKKGFKTSAEARHYLKENEDSLLEQLEKKKQIPPERRGINEPRVGIDYRKGGDIEPQEFADKFGFRGVQFGNYVEQARRISDLNNAYDALLDLASTIGVPPKALSMDGKLGLAFGARGSGGVNPAAAHYEPGHTVINLTKTSGAGSLGHEWWHALDNYFGKQSGTEYQTEQNKGTTPVRSEMVEAFKEITKAIRETGMVIRANELDSTRSKAYWSTTRELPARAFESYLIYKSKEAGGKNDYLANIISPETWDQTRNDYPYPTHEEMADKIAPAFDHFFQTLKVREGENGNQVMFQYADKNPSPTFYSALTREIENVQQGKAPARQWEGIIDNLKNKGVKQEEIDWSGVKDWLREHQGVVPKEELLDYVRAHETQLEEVIKGGEQNEAERDEIKRILAEHGADADDPALSASELKALNVPEPIINRWYKEYMQTDNETKYGGYQLPDGQNYRELLLTLPRNKTVGDMYDDLNAYQRQMHEKYGDGWRNKASAQDLQKDDDLRNSILAAEHEPPRNYKSPHWDESNILAHIRFNDRTGPDGKKILHVEEVQSDWHQHGRKEGYAPKNKEELPSDMKLRQSKEYPGTYEIVRDDGTLVAYGKTKEEALARFKERNGAERSTRVLDAPFKTTWPELAMKRVLRYAVENGYDKVSWTPGDVQNDRYDLSKQIRQVTAYKRQNGKIGIEFIGNDGRTNLAGDHSINDLDNVIGKELATKVTNDFEQPDVTKKTYSDLDLKVGGQGMKGFYDKILPTMMNKMVKKWGAKVGETTIPNAKENKGSDTLAEIQQHYGISSSDWFEMPRSEKDALSEKYMSEKVHSIDITPAMRDSVMQGQPMFEHAGFVTPGKEIEPIKEPVNVTRGLLGERTNEYLAKRKQIEKAVISELHRIAPTARLEVYDRLQSTAEHGSINEALGAAFPRWTGNDVDHIVAVTASSGDPNFTIHHETIHVLRKGAFFTPEENETLFKAARERGWITDSIKRRYAHLSEDGQAEEAVADQFAKEYASNFKDMPPFLRRIFQKIARFFKAVRAAVRRILGYHPDYSDIFHDIDRGEVGRRQSDATPMNKLMTEIAPSAELLPPIADVKFQMADPEAFGEKGKEWPLKKPLEQIESVIVEKLKGTPIERFADGYVKIFSPDVISEKATRADALIAKGKVKTTFAQNEVAKSTQANIDFWDRKTPTEQRAWIKAHETGEYDKNDPYHKYYTAMTDATWAAEHEATGTDPNENYKDNYFSHLFEDPDKARQFIEAKIKKYGKDWFRKKRFFELAEEAEAAGLKLRTTNPEEMLMHRLMAGQTMIQTENMLRSFEDAGLAAKIQEYTPKNEKKADVENNKIDAENAEKAKSPELAGMETEQKQRLITRAKLSPQTLNDLRAGGFTIRGPDGRLWLLHRDVKQLWENAMEQRGLWQDPTFKGDAFRGWMALKNTWVPIKLGLSLFHPAHVATIHVASGMATALENLVNGGSAKDTAKSLGMMLNMGFGMKDGINPMRPKGEKDHPLIQAVKTPEGKRTPEQQEIVKRFEDGGFNPLQSEKDTIQSKRNFNQGVNKFIAEVKSKRALPAAFRGGQVVFGSAQGVIRAASSPFFEHWIPALKAEMYYRRTTNTLNRDPSLVDDDGRRVEAFRKITKDLDRTYGEMNYDTLFWNKTVKDAFQASFLSAGWKLAQLYYYRGFAKTPQLLYDAIKTGKFDPKQASYNIMFSLIYGGLALAVGAALTKWLAGDVKDLSDMIFPRTGEKMPDGTPVRIRLPFFNNEFASLKYHTDTDGLIGGLASFISEQTLEYQAWKGLNNEDVFGRPLVSDPTNLKQLSHLAWNTFDPISFSQFESASIKRSEVGKMAVLFGSGIAPMYSDKTTFENKVVAQYFKDKPGTSSAYQRDLQNDYRIAYGKWNDLSQKAGSSPDAETQAALDAAKGKVDSVISDLKETGMNDKQITSLRKSYTTPFIDYAWSGYPNGQWKGLSAEQQIQLFKDATAEEKARFYPKMKPEAKAHVDYTPPKQTDYWGTTGQPQ